VRSQRKKEWQVLRSHGTTTGKSAERKKQRKPLSGRKEHSTFHFQTQGKQTFPNSIRAKSVFVAQFDKVLNWENHISMSSGVIRKIADRKHKVRLNRIG